MANADATVVVQFDNYQKGLVAGMYVALAAAVDAAERDGQTLINLTDALSDALKIAERKFLEANNLG